MSRKSSEKDDAGSGVKKESKNIETDMQSKGTGKSVLTSQAVKQGVRTPQRRRENAISLPYQRGSWQKKEAKEGTRGDIAEGRRKGGAKPCQSLRKKKRRMKEEKRQGGKKGKKVR